jgi:hypothetical protein
MVNSINTDTLRRRGRRPTLFAGVGEEKIRIAWITTRRLQYIRRSCVSA